MQHIADAITAYTQAGWHLLPLQPGLKIPFPGSRGVKDATSNPGDLMPWVAAGIPINLGLAMGKSGLIAVDIDKRSGGLETIERLATQGKTLPPTLTVATAQQGRHHYFWAPEETVKNAKGKLPGIDIKAGNGYVILPPSRLIETDNHAAGEYTWLDPYSGVKPVPQWLRDLICEKPETVEQVRRQARHQRGGQRPTSRPDVLLDAMCRGLRALPANSYRNNYLFWAANRAAEMIAKGEVAQHSADRALYSAARDCGLTHQETRATINSALRVLSAE